MSAAKRQQRPSSYAPSGDGQNLTFNAERSIKELKKRIDDFLSKVEGSLHVVYNPSRAQKDYEKIVQTLDEIEKQMSDNDMLNATTHDINKSGNDAAALANLKDNRNIKIASSMEELLERAVKEKNGIDVEYGKVEEAASAAIVRTD